ncbi:MAG: hypothetical protein Q8M26_00065 [Pseudolabrys sp.]|nr:hypothetical protein [Pseudolabrys sp.]
MTSFLQSLKAKFRPPRQFENLLLFGWTGTLVAVGGGLLVSFLLLGFWWPYWAIHDMDVWMVYGAWLLNDNLPQEIYDHPGYLSLVLLGGWLSFLHGIGLVAVDRLSQLPSPADAAAAWTHAVRAGRVLSLIQAILFIGGFAFLIRRLVRDWRVAGLATFFLGFSGALSLQVRILRTEIIAAGLVVLCLMLLLVAAQSRSSWWRPLTLGVAALFCALALQNKVQAILLICALPPIILMFRTPPADDNDFWRRSRVASLVLLATAAVALASAAAAWPLYRLGLFGADTNVLNWRPFIWRYGSYQPFMMLWLAGSVVLFAWLNRVSWRETVTALLAALAGGSLGLLALYSYYHPQNVLAVFHPLEQLAFMVQDNKIFAGDNTAVKALTALFAGIGRVMLIRTFVFDSSARPGIFLEWYVIAATIYAYRHGRRELAAQAAMIMAVVWGFDTIVTIRGLKMEYFIFTDPLTIIAAALLTAQQIDLQRHRWAYPVGAALIVAHVVLSQSEPVKHSIGNDPKMYFCQPNYYYTRRIDSFSFCKQ